MKDELIMHSRKSVLLHSGSPCNDSEWVAELILFR